MHLSSLPHHDGSPLYAPDQQSPDGHRRVRVRVPREFGALSSASVRFVVDAEPRFVEMRAIPAPLPGDLAYWWEGSIDMLNPVVGYRFLLGRGAQNAVWLNAEGVDEVEPLDAVDFRASARPAPPAWATTQTMYQIFPDRFARSTHADDREIPAWAVEARWDDDVIHDGPETPRQFFGGDLDGVVEHLDHLAALGVTLIYLTPFFPAGSNHRYDATSFDRVDPLLGGDEALVRLVKTAHARGIRVIGDLTTNHTGDSHEWFQRAFGNPEAIESEFYYWNDDAHTDYVAWYGVPTLPKLNWSSRELRRRFIEGPDSVVAKWLKAPYALDGWRIDVANMTGRHASDDFNGLVQRTVRRTMDEVAPGSILFAESTNDASRDFDGSGWDAPMSYSAFTRPVWHWLQRPAVAPQHHFGIPYDLTPRCTGADFMRSHRRFTAALPWPVRSLAMNAIDTHDTPRFLERADEQLQRVAAALSFALPGTPVLFAGDEFALRGAVGEEARTPLPWQRTPALASFYADLSATRQHSPSLRDGALRWVHADADAVAFVRETRDSSAVVVAFRSEARFSVTDDVFGGRRRLETLLRSGDVGVTEGVGTFEFHADGPAVAIWSATLAENGISARRGELVGVRA